MDSVGHKTILIVEDEAILAVAVKVSLQKLGYTVLTADSGEKSVEVFNSTPGIDLVLMDINLGSGIDGTEAAKLILDEADVPVVFHSSHTEKEIVAKTEKLTSYGYVVKNSGTTVLDASLKMAFRLFDANKKIREKNEKLEILNEVLRVNEKELIREKNFSEKLLESIPGLLYVYDDMGRLIKWNKKHETMTGYTAQELLHMSLADWYDSDELTRVNAAVENIFTIGHGEIEVRLKKKNGEKMLMSLNGVPLTVDEKSYFTGVGIDITEKKKAEEALIQQRILLSTIIESDSDAIFAKDLDGRYHAINEAGAGMIGYTADQVIGHTDLELVPPETAREFMNADRLVINGGIASEIAEKGFINGKMRFFTAKKTPWRDSEGRIIGVIGVTKDVTERKKAEENIRTLLTEKELILKEVHHRIKNNMSTITSLLSLQAGTLDDSAAVQALEDAERRIESMMILYDKLYQSADYNRISVAMYLPTLIDEIMANFNNAEGIAIEKDIGDFILDAKRLQPLGIIMNELLTNIMKYAFAGRTSGTIRVSAAMKDKDVKLIIEDNGVGLDESVDFTNTKGFGLLLVAGLTKQLKGTISIERGNGTRFVLEFGT